MKMLKRYSTKMLKEDYKNKSKMNNKIRLKLSK